jgi:hypothetical protein
MGGKTLSKESARAGAGAGREGEALGKAASVAGIAASMVTVLGFAQTVNSGDGLWVLSGLGTAIFFLYAAWRRRVVAMVASVALLALVALGGLLAPFRSPAQPAGAPASPVSAAAAPSVASTATASAGTLTTRSVEITLPRHAAADLDSGAQPAVAAGQIGLTGDFDLYHDAGEVMSDVIRAPAGMYVYPAGTSPDSAYAICSDYTSAASSDGAYEASAGLETGDAFCFRTTQGKLAWATVEAVQPDSYVAVLQVRIWDEPNGSLGSRFPRARITGTG